MKKVLVIFIIMVLIFSLSSTSVYASGTSIEDMANSTQLQPVKTGCSELDQEIDRVLSQIIKDGMTQYEKLLAIYSYCVLNFTYDNQNTPISMKKVGSVKFENNPLLDTITNYEALSVLKNKIGVCDHYSAAFTALANAVGFETYALTGYITWSNGKSNGHAWSTVKLNNTYYIFDTQAEQYNMRNGKVRYINFGTSTLYNSNYSSFEDVLKNNIVRRNSIISK